MKFVKKLQSKVHSHVIDTQELWSEKLFRSELHNIDNQALAEYVDQLKTRSQGRFASNVGGFQHLLKPEHVTECPAIGDVLEQCTQIANQILTETLNCDLRRPLYHSSCWLNSNDYNSHNAKHLHPNASMICVYYIKTSGSEENGTLSVVNPLLFHTVNTFANVMKNLGDVYRVFNSQVDVIPKENQAVFFFPWVEHMVMPNLDGYERISLAINFR